MIESQHQKRKKKKLQKKAKKQGAKAPLVLTYKNLGDGREEAMTTKTFHHLSKGKCAVPITFVAYQPSDYLRVILFPLFKAL